MSQIIKAMHLKYISIYQGPQTKKMTKKWIADIRWQPFWILRFVEKQCHLQLGIRQKWIQHKKFIWKQWIKYFSSKMPTGLYLGLYFKYLSWLLTQRGKVTHICVGQATSLYLNHWWNISIWSLWTNFCEILIEIQPSSLKEMHLKMSSAKW